MLAYTTRGLRAHTASGSIPRWCLTPGRKFSTRTSACSHSRRNTACPAGVVRSINTDRLLRLRFWGSDPPRSPRWGWPICTTSAPRSASCRVQVGPDRAAVRSITRMPARGPEASTSGASRTRHPVASVAVAGTVRTELEAPIAWVIIDNPERHNAMTSAMFSALVATLARLDGDDEVRVIVLRGAGEAAFAAGADIGELG